MKQYKYETHLHTKAGSACSGFLPEDIITLYKTLGYQGVFVTDHFLNGNTAVPKNLPWKQRIRMVFEAYEQVKALGEKANLDVFFGFESSFYGTDFLVFGLDEEWLANHEDVFTAPQRIDGVATPRPLLQALKEAGALLIQAHPFRQANYIDHVRLFLPDVEGFETINACRDDNCNNMAKVYAETYQKLQTAGSDIHQKWFPNLAGMAFDTPLTGVDDFIARVRLGKGELFSEKNTVFTKE